MDAERVDRVGPSRRVRCTLAAFVTGALLGGGVVAVVPAGRPGRVVSATGVALAGPGPCVKCLKGLPGNAGSSISVTEPDAAAIADREEPALVDVTATLADGSGEAAGTGLILTPTGEILTNNHVIQGSNSITVKISNNVQTFAARLVGTDANDDVAVLQAQGAAGLPTVTLGDSSQVAVGDGVVAIGNAFDRPGPPTVTVGAITALNQSITVQGDLGESEALNGVIQTNAEIQPGNSGGPLFDTSGRVIGMNTAADNGQSPTATTNQSFAIPIDHASAIADQIEGGHAGGGVNVGQEGFLGVSIQGTVRRLGPATAAPGVLVIAVPAGSPAAIAGLGPGARITSIDGQSLTSATRLSQVIASKHPGDAVRLTWVDPSGASRSATIRLTARPSAP